MPTITLSNAPGTGGFRKAVSGRVRNVNVKELTLTCTCAREDVALAMNYYGARVIGEETDL